MSTSGSNIQIESIVFTNDDWETKKANWLANNQQNPFLAANAEMIKRILETPDTGPCIVVNISAASLLSLTKNDARYLNIYDQPVIGGDKKNPLN